MNKSTLALAVAVGVLAQQAGAAGFIEDSKATLGLRNFYINTDNRDGPGANKNEEWGQGFDLRFISGYTQGTVQFGVDAIVCTAFVWIPALPRVVTPAGVLLVAPSFQATATVQFLTSPAWA